MLLMRPELLILQGVYTEYFSFPLAQKLVSLKDERSAGFSDGASPNTSLFSLQTHESVICNGAGASSSFSIEWAVIILKVAARGSISSHPFNSRSNHFK